MNGPELDPRRLRIGQGFDVHRWSEAAADRLVLGGVAFPGHRGLHGHSDADVVAHACADAILGAAGLGDIGLLFPDSDRSLADADSIELLRSAVDRVRAAGWSVVNVDCTVVLDEPKVAPVRDEMQRRLSGAVGAPVTVKGKRTEGMESLTEGVRSHAVALLYEASPTGGGRAHLDHDVDHPAAGPDGGPDGS